MKEKLRRGFIRRFVKLLGVSFQGITTKFSHFGEIVAWQCGTELSLILRTNLKQIIELMYTFRGGAQVVLDGGWSIYRLTTISTVGTIGTEIKPSKIASETLTAADLRRISSGTFDGKLSDSVSSTPKSSRFVSRQPSSHDITTINEESYSPLPNWYENRSPRKRSVATLPAFQKAPTGIRRRSLCTGSSLSSLFRNSKSISLDEAEEESSVPPSSIFSPNHDSSRSTESLFPSATPSRLLSPSSVSAGSKSMDSSPRHKSPLKRIRNRPTKPPNVLILSEDTVRGKKVGRILRNILANDRYVIYDIRWDQLKVGGWIEQTALLVVVGNVLDRSPLLEFLGDGGRLLGWCCEGANIGPSTIENTEPSGKVEYGPNKKLSRPLKLLGRIWGENFTKVVECNDSEGISRPLTTSSWAKLEGSKKSPIIQLDGGSLGGKAILLQIPLELSSEDDGNILLGEVLSQSLGIDCSKKEETADYSVGYVLGDHKVVQELMNSTPSPLKNGDLSIEFIPRGEKGPRPTHERLPIYYMCPPNFSTLEYFNNLETKQLGRVVVYTEMVTSSMDVIGHHPFPHGFTVVASRESHARGRGGNIWLTPAGAALFSFLLHIPLNSNLGRRLSMIQHIGALSVVLATPNHKEIGVQVKWPNDIYGSGVKIGGILVESIVQGSMALLNIGIGVNLSNDHPTLCINSLIEAFNPNAKPKGLLRTESFIANILNNFERLMDTMEQSGVDEFVKLYEDNWIHTHGVNDPQEIVSVEVSDGIYSDCYIAGLDPFGFLKVCSVESGNVFSVRPDGNSFDIANRLIAIKK